MTPLPVQLEKIGARIRAFFATIGSAVGIGNIWLFQYTVGENGSGAFPITHLIIIFTFGLFL